MKKILMVIAVLFFIACSATKKITLDKSAENEYNITQSDADRAMQKFPGTTLADLTQGKSLYEQNCQRCHDLKKPESENESEWRGIMPHMSRKAHIDAQTQD